MEKISILGFILAILYFITTELACNGHTRIDNNVQSEQKALIDFKSGLKDPNNRLSSWKGSNYCYWQGISCENGTGFVISIDLHNPYPRENVYENWSSMNLSGEISPSLIKLKSLKYLDLSFNSFKAMPVPQFFGSLKNLIYLNLSSAGFTIPSNLGNLSNLQYLDLSFEYPIYMNFGYSNDLFVENIEWMIGLPFGSIPSPSFVNFTSLVVIAINVNEFNSKFPEWLLNVSNLVSIDISYNQLHGRIPLGLGELPNLQYLDLSWNFNLRGSIFQLLRKSWKKIEVLNLAQNELHGSIPSSIGNFCNLKYLDLGDNYLNGSLPEIIKGLETCSSKSPLPNLTKLYLHNNQLMGTLPNWLGELKNLSFNLLNGSLPEIIKGLETCSSKSPLPNLTKLSLYNNQLMGKLPNWLGELKNLKALDLSNNKFEGPIPASLGTLQHLEFLSLLENELNGSLPDSIGQLSQLQHLIVYSNHLSGSLPDSIGQLSQLEQLDISSNHLSGSLPDSIGQLSQLQRLQVSSNHLSGSLPDSIGQLSQLQGLHVSSNHLSGSLPDSIGQLSQLEQLDVSSNHLSGSLSEQHFLKLSKLEYLYMGSNSFHLNVSPNWVPLFQVDELDMCSCHLGPSFPAWLQSQKNLNFLDFSNGSISSPIPNWFGNISLNLQRNQITGSIPSNIGEFLPSLQFLSLSGNRITGTIPDSIGRITNLEVIDFSRNNLTGSIPSTINNCSNLFVLDLGNNNLFGIIPKSLGRLQSLESLHLNNNELSGELPSSFQNLTGLEVLDLSYNKLLGEVPAWIGVAFVNLVILNLRSNVHCTKQSMGKIPITLVELKAMAQEHNMINIYPSFQKRTLRNHIIGQIPKCTSMLHQLLSLDLSSNKLSNTIPSSMASLSFLSYLNLSNNNFSGKIPFTGQMTTFTELAFVGNPDLCGAPLATKCQDEDPNKRQSVVSDKNDGGYVDQWFYLSVGLGFAMGILVPFFVLATRKSWCEAYFDFVDEIVRWLLRGRATYAKNHPRRR
ncbi:hypothetical protein AAG906_001822 [Vitis piasezkii]